MNVGTRTAMNRRGFVGLLGLAGVGTVGTAFAPEHIGHAAEIEAAQTVAESAVVTDVHAGHEQMSAQTTTTNAATNATQDMTVDEMDAMHDASVKAFPAATEGLGGQPLAYVYMNEGMMIHPMHLHGMPMQVIAQDGYLLPQFYTCDTLNIAPGQRFEAIVNATEPGTWAFHCHILTHAESDHGMFGMVTALVVEE